MSFSAHDIKVVFGERTILESVSVDVEQSEIVCIIGANGAGKTTLLSCLAGDVDPTEGALSIDGCALGSIDKKRHAKERAVLRQNVHIEFPMVVEDVVALGRIPHRTSAWGQLLDTVVDEQLKRFELEDLRDRYYDTLSGGEQQRTHLARVVAQLTPFDGPRWLLLDEPTAALDVAQSHRLMGYVRELSEDGLGVFWVTHDLNLAAKYANRIGVLKAGGLVALGEPCVSLTSDILADAFGVDAVVQETEDGLVIIVRGAR